MTKAIHHFAGCISKLSIAGACWMLLIQAVHSNAEPLPESLNIVLIIADDISVDDFGCYGHPTIRTPNIDELAAGGMRFTNAYLTTSQCSPSRCSVITGRYPHNTGAPELHMDLPEGQVAFPSLLREAGYYTAAAGKWHLGDAAKNAFDTVVGGGVGGEELWVKTLRERPEDKPFFMWFASFDAHRSWQADSEATPHTPEDAVIPPYMVDNSAIRADMAKYYDEIQRLDRYVGTLVKELKRQGVYENTMIIFMADNGRPFVRCKTRLYDSGIKTPLVIHWPSGVNAGGEVSDSLVSSMDLAPTILDCAGVDMPESIQGVTMRPVLNDPQASIRKYVFAEHNWHVQIAHERMVRHDNYVYIRNAHPQLSQNLNLSSQYADLENLKGLAERGQLTDAQMDSFLKPRPGEELFDVSSDPHQLNNLADESEYAEILADMRKILDQWQQETGDTVPPLDKATPDRHDRETGKRLHQGRRPDMGVIPGQSINAHQINHPGPR